MVPVSLEDWEMRALADSMGDVMSKKADGGHNKRGKLNPATIERATIT